MALIKCPECGTEVSEAAAACVKCGHPIATAKSELIIRGIAQRFLIGGTVTALIDGKAVAKVRKREIVTLPITHTCLLTIRCGINTEKAERVVQAGRTTKLQVVYDRLEGTFYLEEFR